MATRPDLYDKLANLKTATERDVGGRGEGGAAVENHDPGHKFKIKLRLSRPSSSSGENLKGPTPPRDASTSLQDSELGDVDAAEIEDDPEAAYDQSPGSPGDSTLPDAVVATNGRDKPEPPLYGVCSLSVPDEEDDCDREDDPDYVQTGDGGRSESDSDDGTDTPVTGRRHHSKPPPKTKADKALQFRNEVNALRETKASGAISKSVATSILLKRSRKDEDLDAPGHAGSKSSSKDKTKRARHEEPSGLLKNFRPTKKSASSSRSEPTTDGEVDEYNGGVFDKDEDEESMKRARNSKSNAVKAMTRGSKAETTVRVTEPAAPAFALAVSRRRFKKDQCKKSNLPFPSANANRCFDRWDKRFKSTAITWNGSLRQPFSSSTLLADEVRVIWEKVFGALAPLDDDDERWYIVEVVTADFLLNWRSEIGRVGIMVTVAFLRQELDVAGMTNEGEINARGVEAATYLLEDLRFVYGNPDADPDTGESAEPFQSSLVLETFTYHLRQAVYRIDDYKPSKETGKHAIGALGLCAAAVERALTLIKDGHITIEIFPPALLPPVEDRTTHGTAGMKGSGKRRKAPYTSFSEAGWGEETRGYVETAEDLPRDQWESIVEKATNDEIEAILDALDDGAGEGLSGHVRAKKNVRARLRK
ncbi:hypothetical protein MD484_g7398, partial [Candolleomyces efflorescens]